MLLPGQNLLDFAWRFEPTALRTRGKHCTTVLPSRIQKLGFLLQNKVYVLHFRKRTLKVQKIAQEAILQLYSVAIKLYWGYYNVEKTSLIKGG